MRTFDIFEIVSKSKRDHISKYMYTPPPQKKMKIHEFETIKKKTITNNNSKRELSLLVGINMVYRNLATMR